MQKKHSVVDYSKYGYFFSIPFIVTFLIFTLYPVLYTLVIGFTDLKGLGNTSMHFLSSDPFANFKEVLSSDLFRLSLANTCRIWIYNFIPQLGLALLLTAWFTDNRLQIKAKAFFKVIFYLPNIITMASIAILFRAFFGYPMGPMNDLVVRFKGAGSEIKFLQDRDTTRNIVAFIQFWMWYGYTMVQLVSGVIGISPDIFEAAEIDGANRVQTFFFITIPNIRTILLFTLVTSLIGGLNMFDIPRLLMNGGPDNATITASLYIYNQAFSGSYRYNQAAAASMIMFVLIIICSAILFYIMRDKDEAALKKLRKMERKAQRG